MYWSSEEWLLLVTGVLFAAAAAASTIRFVTLTRRSQVTFTVGAAAFLVAAYVLAQIEAVVYPPFLWILPLVPLVILGVMARDAVAASAAAAKTPRTPATADAGVTRASVIPVATAAPGSPSDRLLRMRAADPAASPQELARIAYAHRDMRTLIAGNPATPASLLEWLASVGDPAVHAAISSRQSAVA